MDIIIGCDNAAVQMKNAVKKLLAEKGVNVLDKGCFSEDDGIYYPNVAKAVCEEIIAGGFQKRGILICGTGIGMAMAANKFKGIRAAVCHDNYSAERSILSNNGNVLCMGARVIGIELAKKIVSEWITLNFTDGSSTPKVEAICAIETQTFR